LQRRCPAWAADHSTSLCRAADAEADSLLFEENKLERTQQFVLRWSSDGGQSYREIVRQQYNFSPPNTYRECKDYNVDLDCVTALDLTIVPDISGAPVCATLAQLRVV
jgi:hypothetical protein